MAVIAQTNSVKGTASAGAVNVTRTTLTSSDSLTFFNGSGQNLFLYNTTASPVVVTLAGDSLQPLPVPGYGGSVPTAGGKAITVPATGATSIELDDIYGFLAGSGAVAVTGGTGVVAMLFT